jgi:hypothetical protein
MKLTPANTLRNIIFIVSLTSFSHLQGQLVFSEVMAVNTDGKYNPVTGEPGDWIEIYNGTPYAIDLSGFCLSDDPDDPLKWRFPQRTYVWSHSYHLIWADGTNDTLRGSHAGFKLAAAGETLLLSDFRGVLYDSLSYPVMYENVSYGTASDGSMVYFSNPTPGEINDSESGFRVTGGVEFDPPAGILSGPVQVRMIPEVPGSLIRYTLDGSTPSISDPVYTSPIQVTEDMVIRARLWTEGFEPGRTATSTYLVNRDFTLPVISLATDPDNLWDDQTGIYVEGTNGRPGYCESEPKNWNQAWERPVSLEYFDAEGIRRVQHDGGVKIHGGCSRQAPLKSLAFFARSRYGNNLVRYPFFSQKDADGFKGLIFRNSGNDFWYAYMRDAVVQAVVVPHMDLDDQAYEPVQLFLNGEYWGIHNMREKVNEHWVTSNYGLPDEDIDFIKNRNEVFAGSNEGIQNLYAYLEEHSLAGEAEYQEVARQIDMDSHQEYLITEMFFANRDWPGNNQKFWRNRVNGSPWRWILMDLDFCFGLYTSDAAFDMFSFSTSDTSDQWPNPRWATLMTRRLLENEGFRNDFLGKYMIHLNTTLTTDHVIQVIDSFYYRLHDVFPAHIDRWNHTSMENWSAKVEEMRQFARVRPWHVWQNMQAFFGLGQPVTLRVEPAGHRGIVLANGIEIPQEGFNGKYAPGFDLSLEYRPLPGYQLRHWESSRFEVLDTVLLPRGASWRYSDTGIFPGAEWNREGYDDSGWAEGPAELGYGDEGEVTLLDFGGDSLNKHISYYFRTTLDLEDPAAFEEFTLRVLRDDGVVVYINGEEAMRDNMPPGEITPETMALVYVGGADESRYFEYVIRGDFFSPGTNLIAVEIHQQNPASSDLGFDLELSASTLVPIDTVVHHGSSLALDPIDGILVRPVLEEQEFDPDMELYINEFMASNNSAHTDEYGEDEDWIEIFNAGDEPVNLAGLYLTDDLEEPGKWRIPDGFPVQTTVDAGSFLVLYADGDPDQGPWHLDFRLSADGEAIGLSALYGDEVIWIDTVRFRAQLPDISFGRYPDGSDQWASMNRSTPGTPNLVTAVAPPRETGMQISLFPNPASDRIYFNVKTGMDDPSSRVDWSIMDLTGRRVMEGTIQAFSREFQGSAQLKSLSPGCYFLVVECGPHSATGKFLKSSR